jgi:hypothetical protein
MNTINSKQQNNLNIDSLVKQRQRTFEQQNSNIRINWEHYKAVLLAKLKQYQS